MADQASTDLQASQTGKDPITGSILSPETRKLLFKRSQMSASSFLGGGGGSAIVPVNRGGVDTQTLAIVKADQSAIETLKKQVNALVKRDDDFLAQVTQISSIQQAQINSLTQTVIGLGADFEAVRVSIINDTLLEQQKLRQENEYEKQLAEQGLREGKEKLLEQKIQNALMAPIAAIGNKVSSIFDKLMNFMWTLLGGWLTMQGLDTLKALATGNKKKLEDIKNNVIKALVVIGGSLLFIQFGLGTLIGSITRLAFKASKFVFSNTIGRLFTGLVGIGKQALGLGVKAAPKAVATGAGAAVPVAAKSKVPGGGIKMKGMGGPLNAFFGGLEFFGRKSEGQTNLQAGAGAVSSVAGSQLGFTAGAATGAWLGAFGGPLAPFTVPAGALIGGIAGGTGGWWGGGKLSDTFTGVEKNESGENKEQTPAKTTPQNKVIPSKKKQQTTPAAQSSSTNTAFIVSGTGEPESTSAPPAAQITPSPAQTSPAQMQSMPKSTENLGQLSEPNAQVVMLNSPQAQSSQKPQSSLRSGSATDVPLFSSSNPDNFYSLYAQVNYNVIL
jgi:hypothetical protein